MIYLLTPLCKVFKKRYEGQIFDDALFLGPKCHICQKPEFIKRSLEHIQTYVMIQSVFKKNNVIMIYILTSFIVHKFKKFLVWIYCYGNASFSDSKFIINESFTPKKNLQKNQLIFNFRIPFGLFHCAKFEKIPKANAELWWCVMFGLKWPIGPNRNIYRKSNNISLIYVLSSFIK